MVVFDILLTMRHFNLAKNLRKIMDLLLGEVMMMSLPVMLLHYSLIIVWDDLIMHDLPTLCLQQQLKLHPFPLSMGLLGDYVQLTDTLTDVTLIYNTRADDR